MVKRFRHVDIDTPAIREFVKGNTAVFRKAMDGLVEASQNPEATSVEENIGLLLRSTVAYAHGICKTFGVSPEQFADLMHFFDDVKISQPPIIKDINS